MNIKLNIFLIILTSFSSLFQTILVIKLSFISSFINIDSLKYSIGNL